MALEALPTAVLAVGLVAFVVTRPTTVVSLVRTPQGLAVSVGLVALWLGLGALLRRTVGSPALRATTRGLAAVALLALLVVPSYRPQTVVEALPVAAAAPPAASAGDRDAAPKPAGPARQRDAAPAPARPGESRRAPPTERAPAAEEAPVAVTSGALVGIGHRASGTANVLRQPDGSFVVELADIDVEPGPDYYVHLVPGPDATAPDGGLQLGRLRGTRGTQYYPVGGDVARPWTVLIWCRAFAVPVAAAIQESA